jgi:hypothetical protein
MHRLWLPNLEGLLDDPNVRSRARAIQHTILGVGVLKQQVIEDARANPMSWATVVLR